jgi:carboxyl-terminal processing protease
MKTILRPVRSLILTVALLLLIPAGSGNCSETENTYKNLEIFSSILSLIQQNYVEKVESREVIEGAIKGMLLSLDPHSSYLKPDDFKELQVETKGSFSGIGIEITIQDSILTVVSPIEGTPADQKGLRPGDKILKINGESTKELTLMEAVKKLRGPKGSEVTISIHREGWTELKDITLKRDVIPLHSVKSRILEPGYGYIKITNFQAKTSSDLQDALEEMTGKQEIKGLILDLRNNPGGLLDQSVKVSDLFLKEGVIVSTRGRLDDQNIEYTAHGRGPDYDFPMIVLVNEGSASASEIVAGALQDHRRALILGTRTFGKGSVQTIIPMGDGSGLRLTTARYYTPSGTSIQATGIEPDVVVPALQLNAVTNGNARNHLREKDLKGHLENGNAKEDPTIKESKDSAPETGPDKAAMDEAEIAKDNQLHTALLILKGLNVLSSDISRE